MSDRVLPIPDSALTDPKGNATTHGKRYLDSLGNSVNSMAGNRALKEQTWSQEYLIPYPEDKSHPFIVKTPRTITSVATRTTTGTCTVTVKIGSTPLGGSANAASTTIVTEEHDADNQADVDDILNIEVSDSSSPENLSVTLSGTLTLA